MNAPPRNQPAPLRIAFMLGMCVAAGCQQNDQAETALDAATQASRAIEALEKRAVEDPWNYVVGGRLVDRYLQRFRLVPDVGDLARAEQLAKHLVEATPDRATALARLSMVSLTRHEFASAYEAAAEAFAMDSSNESAQAVLFDAALATGRYETAKAALDRLPGSSLPQAIRSTQWLIAKGDQEAAYDGLIEVCRAIERSTLRAQVLAWCVTELAKIQQQRRGADSAAVLLDYALDVQPGYPGAVEALADMAYGDANWPEAARLYETVATPAHPDIYLRLVEVAEATGDSTAAAEWELRFLEVVSESDDGAMFAHALALYHSERAGGLDAALEIVRDDLSRRRDVGTYDLLSWILFRRGDYEDALSASDKAMRFGSPSATTEYHRGSILDAMNRKDEAAVHFARALEDLGALDPHALRHYRSRSEG